MVWQKRLDYGFHGYQFPPTPRAARSPRRKCVSKKSTCNNIVCAFDLLAIVAGDFLIGKETPSSSDSSSANKNRLENANGGVKDETQNDDRLLEVESQFPDIGSKTVLTSDLISRFQEENKSSINNRHNLSLPSAGASDIEDKPNSLEVKSCHGENEASMAGRIVDISDSQFGFQINKPIKNEIQTPEIGTEIPVGSKCKVDDPVTWNGKSEPSFDAGSFPQVPLSVNEIPPIYPIPSNQEDAHVLGRDDDENSSECTYPRTNTKYFRSEPRIGDRRIRKILASRHWKVSPRPKEASHCCTDGVNSGHICKKNVYKHQRSEKIYPFKKRKFFQYGSLSPPESDGVLSSEVDLDSLRKRNDEGSRASSPVTPENTSFQPRASHVKIRIKSFRVPELFIEIPESETVGSLKRNVMDAVTAILGDGLGIGVLLKGKNVRDDSKTLLQCGISHGNHLDSVCFSLEPNPCKPNATLCHGASPLLLHNDTSRYPPSLSMVDKETGVSDARLNNLRNAVDSDHDSAPSQLDISSDKSTSNSKALVAVPSMNAEALSAVPSYRNSKRSEMVQRRIRRPFSVAEVEALVQAVEKLGTGRWRDVKLRAFENAKHRTYVDLKDKWKTLVHTARISPQQRRGEPVPQELLDRVLATHAYWSHHQAKQHQVKHHQHAHIHPPPRKAAISIVSSAPHVQLTLR